MREHQPDAPSSQITPDSFYGEFHGHKVRHLESVLPSLRTSSEALIWTAGDSSLDNKYWFFDTAPAVGAYAQVLVPPVSKCDVTYWLNYLARSDDDGGGDERSGGSDRNIKWGAINTAVEATTLNQRVFRLLPQDRFIRDNILSDDVLVVSVGGNDIALCPTLCTIAAVAGTLCLPYSVVENGCTCATVPANDCCCGCGASLLSCGCAFPPCLGYMRHLFGTRVQKYVEAMTRKTKPKKVLVCMIYYLDENTAPSWAGPALAAMGYNRNPEKLQMVIRKVFAEATSRIRIPGSEVIPVPLFHALDGKQSRDYVARVEPSPTGGRKIAELLLDIINRPSQVQGDLSAPAVSLIQR